MKLSRITEERYFGQTEPGFVSVDWGDYVELYGPFKTRIQARQFEDKFFGLIKKAGFDHPADVDIFSINTHSIIDPQEAIDELKKHLEDYT